jgi:hypothetical protein
MTRWARRLSSSDQVTLLLERLRRDFLAASVIAAWSIRYVQR